MSQGRHVRVDARKEYQRRQLEQEARNRFPGCDAYRANPSAEPPYVELKVGNRWKVWSVTA